MMTVLKIKRVKSESQNMGSPVSWVLAIRNHPTLGGVSQYDHLKVVIAKYNNTHFASIDGLY